MMTKGRGWLMAGIAMGIIALGAYLWFEKPHGNGFPNLGLAANLAEAKSNMSSVGGCGASDNARFACQSVLLVNESGHPLMDRVCKELRKQLSTTFSEVSVADVGVPNFGLPPKARVPDVILRLNAASIKTTGFPPLQKLHVNLSATMGDTAWPSNHHYFGCASLPVIQWYWTGNLEHESMIAGIEIPKYASVSVQLAKQLSEAILKQTAEYREKYGVLPPLPPECYGPFHAAPELRLPDGVKSQQRMTACGLFSHNQTFWTFTCPADPEAYFERLRKQFESEGWKDEGCDSSHLRMRRQEQVFSFYQAAQDSAKLLDADKLKSASASQKLFIAHFEEGFSGAERAAAIDGLFAKDAPVEILLMMEWMLTKPQQDQLAALIKSRSPSSPQAWIYLANHLEKPDALQFLKRAKALLGAVYDSDALEKKISQTAETRAGVKTLTLAPSDYKEAGFEELTVESPSIEVERALNDPVCFFCKDPAGKIETVCFQVRQGKTENGVAVYDFIQIEKQESGRSRSLQTQAVDSQKQWKFTGYYKRSLGLNVTLRQDGRFSFLIKPMKE